MTFTQHLNPFFENSIFVLFYCFIVCVAAWSNWSSNIWTNVNNSNLILTSNWGYYTTSAIPHPNSKFSSYLNYGYWAWFWQQNYRSDTVSECRRFSVTSEKFKGTSPRQYMYLPEWDLSLFKCSNQISKSNCNSSSSV